MPRYNEHDVVHDDVFGIHDWALELQECPITGMNTDGSKKVHSHHYCCAACGIRRHGAFAEQGAYHYFVYDQWKVRFSSPALAEEFKRRIADTSCDFFTHELLPPCAKTRQLPSGIEVYEIDICAECFHYVQFYDGSLKCQHGCSAGTITLLGCFKRKT
ncbi:hypothetical protein HZC53_04270 [Candidatus Uhrbacteria bacterium]|nr:hypothetical protein [Candidatus Uhrbacteria bacterium]